MNSRNKSLEELTWMVEIQNKKEALVLVMKRWQKTHPSGKTSLLQQADELLNALSVLEGKQDAAAKVEDQRHAKETAARGW